jgi:hypothetical protein
LRAPVKTAISLVGGQFTDIKEEMLKRLSMLFEKWLNP